MNTAYHSQYWAHALTLRGSGGDIAALSRSIANARVDFNPHQIDAALFALRSPFACSIKRNPRDKHTAWDLLTSMTKASKTIKVQKVPAAGGTAIVVSDGPPSLVELVTALTTTLNDIRNTVGDHFNWDAAEITNATVREFGEMTQTMCRILLCDQCGGMATRNKRTHLQCCCGKLLIRKD